MKYRVTEHIPNCCEFQDLNRTESIVDESELNDIPWLQRFKPYRFLRGSLGTAHSYPNGQIVTDYDPGKQWVVAIVRPVL